MISGYPIPNTSTLSFGDIYGGVGSQAPSVEKATNPAPTQAAANTNKPTTNSVTGGGGVLGMQVPTLITLGVIALVLVRYY